MLITGLRYDMQELTRDQTLTNNQLSLPHYISVKLIRYVCNFEASIQAGTKRGNIVDNANVNPHKEPNSLICETHLNVIIPVLQTFETMCFLYHPVRS